MWQGILTVREDQYGWPPCTFVQISCFWHKYLNEEVNCIKNSTSVSLASMQVRTRQGISWNVPHSGMHRLKRLARNTNTHHFPWTSVAVKKRFMTLWPGGGFNSRKWNPTGSEIWIVCLPDSGKKASNHKLRYNGRICVRLCLFGEKKSQNNFRMS